MGSFARLFGYYLVAFAYGSVHSKNRVGVFGAGA